MEDKFFYKLLCNPLLRIIHYKINHMNRKLFFSFLLLVMAMAFTFSTRLITGTILDDAGKPVIAQVMVKKSKKTVLSLADGRFSIDIGDEKEVTLVISCVGFQTKEVKVGKEDKLTIRLKQDIQALSEVIIVG